MPDYPFLLTSKPSPFGRLARAARLHLGLQDQIAVDMPAPEKVKLSAEAISPLARIPILVLSETDFIVDSRTIMIYFDQLASEPALKLTGPQSAPVLSRLAIVTGLLDSALLILYEGRFHTPENRSADWIAMQNGKILETLTYFSGIIPEEASSPIDGGDLALAIALEYLDFRFEGAWRADHPKLVNWLESMNALVPTLAQTSPLSA